MNKIKLLANTMLLALVGSITVGTIQAATLSFVSPTETLTKGCPVQIDVMINTEGKEVNSADFVLIQNDSFVLNEVDTSKGVFRTYTQPTAATARDGEFKGEKVVRIVATTSAKKGFNGDGNFLSLTITPKADQVDLNLYAIKDSAGDDTNLSTIVGDKAEDILSDIDTIPVSYKVVEGSCTVAPLEAITLKETPTTVVAQEVENIVEDTTNLNEENVFDTAQTKTFLEENWLYLAIGIVILIIIIFAIKPKNKKKA